MKFTTLLFVFTGITAILAWPACRFGTPPTSPPLPLFEFNPKKVTELTLIKNDPETQDHWSTRLKRSDSNLWEMAASSTDSSEHPELHDRRADSNYILHLLDALKSLRAPKNTAPPQASETTLGLSPPWFTLRWQALTQIYEIQIGAQVPQSKARYARESARGVFVAEGAFLGVLGHLSSFEKLRETKLLDLPSEDVDEFEIRAGGKLLLYAQRDGDDWVDRKHKHLPERVPRLLEELTQIRINKFIDTPDLLERAQKDLKAHPKFMALLKDRHGNPTAVTIARIGKKTLGTTSSRKNQIFEIDGEKIELMVLTPNRL